MVKEVRLARSASSLWFLIAGCSLFVGGGIWLLAVAEPEARPAAWACVGFFGIGLLMSLYHLIDKTPELIINEVGIKSRGVERALGRELLEWEVIKSAHMAAIYGRKFLSIEVEETAAPSYGQDKFAKGFAAVGKSIGLEEINLPVGLIQIDYGILVNLINNLAKIEKKERAAKLRQFEQRYLS
jgi:hypothetical protein